MDDYLLENRADESIRKRQSPGCAPEDIPSKTKRPMHGNEKEEAFDAFHKMLNSCTDESSFNVSDAATLLRQMTPSVISSVLQLVSQKIASESQRSSPTVDSSVEGKEANNATDPEGDNEIMLIVSESNTEPNDRKTLGTIGSNSCSPISAAVQALMSFNTRESYLKLSMADEETSGSITKETLADHTNQPCTPSVFIASDKQCSDNESPETTEVKVESDNDTSHVKEEFQKIVTNRTLFTPIASSTQIHDDLSMSSNHFTPELLLPTLTSLMNPLSVPYVMSQPMSNSSIVSSSVSAMPAVNLTMNQKQIAPRPILPKPAETLLSASLASMLQKGGVHGGGNYLSNPILPPEIASLNQTGISSASTKLSHARVSNCPPASSTNAFFIPKYCTSPQVLQMPIEGLDLQQLLLRAQLCKPTVTSSTSASTIMCDLDLNKLAVENTPTSNILNAVGLKPEHFQNTGNLQVAASALLSIGGSGKQKHINNQQVVAAFNKQKATYDFTETIDASKNDVVFTSSGTFQIEDVEIDPRKNKIEKDNYECGKCRRVFTSIIYLARHIKRVCPDMSHRKWKCDRCEKAFRHPFGLQQHVYTHTGERPFKCEQCSKAFYSANDLRRHKRTHSGERPYKCSHCSKTFSTTISLKTHTFIHTGERPHKCPACPKTFATSSKLSRHFVTHSDQRPFCCDLCPKTFNRSGDLRRHYNNIHEQEHKLIECNECNKVFATQQCLTTHRLTHNRDLVPSTKPVHVVLQ